MFTGIVTDIGEIVSREDGRFTIACSYDAATIEIGASIASDGCCLTVTSLVRGPDGRTRYTVDVSNETLSKTTLGEWEPGRRVNLERALSLGAELGGHLVTGHIDGVATIVSARTDGGSTRYEIAMPRSLAGYIAAKGSVALDGTSLTVNDVDGLQFGVNIIPHTQAVTTWGGKGEGDRLNMEVDLLARYVARLAEVGRWS